MALYGAQLYQSPVNETNIRYDVIGKTAEVTTAGDVVTLDSNTVKPVAAATDPILGVAAASVTAAQNDGTKYVPFMPADENDVWLMGCNAALTDNTTDYGTFYGLTGATGVQQVNVTGGVTTTTSRQVMIVKVDPNKVGGTDGLRQCLVKFVRIPQFNGAFN
jgi:hypothetical protein